MSAETPLPQAPAEPATPRLALRAKEAALALSISERALWGLTAANQIPHVRLGKIVVYPVDALRTWLDDRAEGGAR